MRNTVHAERGIRRDIKFTVQTAIGIRLDAAGIDLFIFRIVNRDRKRSTGIGGCICLIILGMPNPEFKSDFLLGAIDRPIGHDKGFGLAVFAVVIIRVPDTRKTQKCQPAAGADNCQPLIVRLYFRRRQDDPAVAVGSAGKIFVSELMAVFAFKPFGAIAEKINPGVTKGFSVDGICCIIQHPFVEGFFDKGRVADPDNDAGGVAVVNFADQQVGAGLIQRLGKVDSDTPVPVLCIGF